MFKAGNRFWFQLHGWFSLPVWVLFFAVCLTGSIAVVSHELTWLTNTNARADNPEQLPQMPAQRLIDVVTEHYPSAHVTGISFQEPYMAAMVLFTDSDKPYAVAYVNQYTGALQEVNDGNTFTNFMRSLHGWLLFPWHHSYSVGYYLVSSMAIVMLGALVTGLIVYKRFWRSFIRPQIRWRQGGRTLLADLHKLTGVWSIWFMLVMSLTGLWYLVQAVLWHQDVEIEPYPELLPVAELPHAQRKKVPQPPYDLTAALAEANQRFEGFRPSYIMLPEHHRDTIKVSGYGDFILYDNYSYNLALNPWTGKVEQAFSPASMGPLATMMHIADPLHFGYLGGLWTKILWCFSGLLLSGMVLSGFLMWHLRVFRSRRRSRQSLVLEVG